MRKTERELLDRIGICDFLACCAVARRERPAGRIVVPLDQVVAVVAAVRRLGALCRRSRFDYRPGRDAVSGGGRHEGGFVPVGEGTFAVVYFGIEDEFMNGAEEAEFRGDHLLAACLFGYPECCAQAFHARPSSRLDRTADAVIDLGPFECVLHPLLRAPLGLRLIFHFPCSLRCPASLAAAQARRRALSRIAPQLENLLSKLRGIALYGPEIGLGLVSRFTEVAANRFEVYEVTTADPLTTRWFERRSRPLLELCSPHRFLLDEHRFEDPRQFAAVFA